MKKISFLIVILGILFGSYFGWTSAINQNYEKKPIANPAPVETAADGPQPTQTQTKVGKPLNINIPSINVDAFVESVTVDAKGNMDVPRNWSNTAWYSPGPKPGESGSAVINGHVDTPQGNPAVFAGIGNLNKGDIIKINDENGKTYTFAVTKVETYSLATIPLKEIFSRGTPSMLNLITCSGVWNDLQNEYSHRTVVYSILIG